MMSPEIKGNADFRIPSIKEKIVRSFAAVALGCSSILISHQDRESSDGDFLQILPIHALSLETEIQLLNPETDVFELHNLPHKIEGPKAPTEQEMLEDITYQFENMVKIEQAVQVKEEQKEKSQKNIPITNIDGQVTASSISSALDNVWDKLAHCESTDDWHINTGNGYYGGLQMDLQFWTSYGGLEFAKRPDLATREQQITVAERARDSGRGYGPWPTCGPKNGLG